MVTEIKLVSFVLPVFNEEDNVIKLYRQLVSLFSDKFRDYRCECIFVNDGSLDASLTQLLDLAKKDSRIKVISYPQNRGKGFAVREGMRQAKGAYRFFLDTDGAFDLKLAAVFLEKCMSGYPIVIGSIEIPNSGVHKKGSWYRYVFGKLSKKFIRFFLLPNIHDSQRGIKLFTDKAAEIVFSRQTLERWGFDTELLVIANIHKLAIVEVPVYVNDFDNSSVSLLSYFSTLVEMMRIKLNQVRGKYGHL